MEQCAARTLVVDQIEEEGAVGGQSRRKAHDVAVGVLHQRLCGAVPESCGRRAGVREDVVRDARRDIAAAVRQHVQVDVPHAGRQGVALRNALARPAQVEHRRDVERAERVDVVAGEGGQRRGAEDLPCADGAALGAKPSEVTEVRNRGRGRCVGRWRSWSQGCLSGIAARRARTFRMPLREDGPERAGWAGDRAPFSRR